MFKTNNPINNKEDGQIQVNIPRTNRIPAIIAIAHSNEQIAVALQKASQSNIEIAKALQVSPQISIVGNMITTSDYYDTAIRINGESDYDEYVATEIADNEDEEEIPCCDCDECEEPVKEETVEVVEETVIEEITEEE